MKSVNYLVQINDIAAHLVDIQLSFTPNQDTHILSLPAWIPGSYMIRDFARNIISINAHDANGKLPLTQLDKHSWQVQDFDKKSPITLCYQVYAYDLSVRAAYIDDDVAVLNPAALCLSVSEQENRTHIIDIEKPRSFCAEHWQVATGLTRHKNTTLLDFGRYEASDYATLIDSPLLIGNITVKRFSAGNITHYLVVTGNNLTDLSRLTSDLQTVCEAQIKVFGTLPNDISEYWFLLWVTDNGYGGLEHLNSTLLLCSRFDLPAPNSNNIDDNYQNLLALCSHEYFHTWWVKRLKPSCFLNYQLSAEQYTPQLWLYEGFTSYYDDLALVRSGLIDHGTYLKTLNKMISRVMRNPSDSAQSLVDSSFTAWTKFYKQDENAVNAVVSYYAKGALLALCLDAKLQELGSNLDVIVRHLYQHYLQSGTPDNALEQSLSALGFNELASDVTTWLYQQEPLPLKELLPSLGISLTTRAMQSADDFGLEPTNNNVYLGAQTKQVNNLIQLTHVYYNEVAHKAGLMVGDELIAIEGFKITPSSLQPLLQRLPKHEKLTLHYYRKDRLLSCNLILEAASQQVATLNISDNEKCQKWLKG